MKIAVCTAFHELARPFLDAYVQGLAREFGRQKRRGREVLLVAAIDDLKNPEAALASLVWEFPVVIRRAEPGSSIAQVRGVMLEAGRSCDADRLIFVDADDVIESDSIDLHVAALDHADISFGDAQPIDVAGNPIGPTLFEGVDVPSCVETSAPILRRNFFGLSNTAIRRRSLDEAACRPPRENDATDWWVFTTLLDAGRKARRTEGVVVRYRMHGANLLGSTPAMTAAAILSRCRMALVHFLSLPATEDRAIALADLRRLESMVATDPEQWSAKASDLHTGRRLWFEDVFRLANCARQSQRQGA